MPIQSLCVFGGGGFVGHHLVSLLATRGYRVRIPARRREDAKDLAILPGVEVVEADIHDPGALASLLAGMDAAVNLVGILHETASGDADTPGTRRGGFRQAHVALPGKIVVACRQAGVGRLLHMSALGADPGALAAIDGVTLVVGDRLLLVTGAAGADNGIYAVSQVGDGGTPFILVRTLDANTSAKLLPGTTVRVYAGTKYAGTRWSLAIAPVRPEKSR